MRLFKIMLAYFALLIFLTSINNCVDYFQIKYIVRITYCDDKPQRIIKVWSHTKPKKEDIKNFVYEHLFTREENVCSIEVIENEVYNITK